MTSEVDVVFNVVWTGSVFRYLRYFVASQMAHSQARFRFVNNGCDAAARDAIGRFAASRPDRVVEVLDVSIDTMERHGDVLDAVHRQRDDGPLFALIDADILARGPFLAPFMTALSAEDTSAVTSGRGIWSESDVVPVDHPGVNGEYFRSPSGFLFGSPHFAIYERAALDETMARWQIGFGSGGATLRPDAKQQLLDAGLDYLLYDTGKLVNTFLQLDGRGLVHFEHPDLMHVGGVSHYLSPTGYLQGDDGADIPNWSKWHGMETRFAVAEFTAEVIRALDRGDEPPERPTTIDGTIADRLDTVPRRVDRARPPVPTHGRGGSLTVAEPGSEIVFNIVWTGEVFTYLRYFVCSILHHSGARARFVANGCTPESIADMERFASTHDSVVEVLDVSPDEMVAHGVALDRVRSARDDGDHFCLMDADIRACGPFLDSFLQLLASNAAVTSGREVWNDDNVVPVGHGGVGGRHFFDVDGFVFGSPHLALYRRGPLDEVCDRWQVGLGSAGPELSAEATAALASLGHRYLVYDTAKIVNILLQHDGYGVVHIEHENLMHIGGMSHYLAPPKYIVRGEGREPEPDWVRYQGMESRHEVARFTATMLRELVAGNTAPPLPDGTAPELRDRLEHVRAAMIDLIEEHRSC